MRMWRSSVSHRVRPRRVQQPPSLPMDAIAASLDVNRDYRGTGARAGAFPRAISGISRCAIGNGQREVQPSQPEAILLQYDSTRTIRYHTLDPSSSLAECPGQVAGPSSWLGVMIHGKLKMHPSFKPPKRSAETRSTSTRNSADAHARSWPYLPTLFAPWNDSHVRWTDLLSASRAAIRQARAVETRGGKGKEFVLRAAALGLRRRDDAVRTCALRFPRLTARRAVPHARRPGADVSLPTPPPSVVHAVRTGSPVEAMPAGRNSSKRAACS
ncbi:hypothetical protein CPLU01_05259 [Colletotrichum plurivorum]|uniref:Uncharacterized protein n=1 Tax=Colletotrichum plurivorum TaxID=2175906 RepID=A0A8H6KLW8_9PEZI|nr:hypothetical protein CPLU01_05259 [Colletotrichum plurivorum]